PRWPSAFTTSHRSEATMGDTPKPIGKVRLRQRNPLEGDTLAPPTHRQPMRPFGDTHPPALRVGLGDSESPPAGQAWQRVETRLLGVLRLARRLAGFFGPEVTDELVLRLADMVLRELDREPPAGMVAR